MSTLRLNDQTKHQLGQTFIFLKSCICWGSFISRKNYILSAQWMECGLTSYWRCQLAENNAYSSTTLPGLASVWLIRKSKLLHQLHQWLHICSTNTTLHEIGIPMGQHVNTVHLLCRVHVRPRLLSGWWPPQAAEGIHNRLCNTAYITSIQTIWGHDRKRFKPPAIYAFFC